tara:strand:- start:1913 stop:2242 length:330 start_codon:yes stop_codon:yes gene_type:complete
MKSNNKKLVRVDGFYKAYKRVRPYNVYTETITVLADAFSGDAVADCEMLLRLLPFGIGTAQTGVFEIQTDKGIYKRKDGRDIRLMRGDKTVSPRLVGFKTWEQIESETN